MSVDYLRPFGSGGVPRTPGGRMSEPVDHCRENCYGRGRNIGYPPSTTEEKGEFNETGRCLGFTPVVAEQSERNPELDQESQRLGVSFILLRQTGAPVLRG